MTLHVHDCGRWSVNTDGSTGRGWIAWLFDRETELCASGDGRTKDAALSAMLIDYADAGASEVDQDCLEAFVWQHGRSPTICGLPIKDRGPTFDDLVRDHHAGELEQLALFDEVGP